MKAVTRVWTFAVRNWDVLLTMLVAIAIAILSYVQVVASQGVSTAILSVLFLISCSLLINRETNNRLQQTTDKIWERMQKPSIDEIIIPYKKWMEDIESQLNSANEVWVLSRTCTRFWEDYQTQLQKIIDRKGSLRFLLVNPGNGALRMIADSVELIRNHELSGKFKQVTQENASNRLALLRGRIEDFVQYITVVSTHVGKGHLELRTIEYLPAHTLVIINGHNEEGIIFVELGTFSANGRNRPTFALVKSKDTELFSLYYNEYKVMWDSAYSMGSTQ